jgi:ankyrin repeat protein
MTGRIDVQLASVDKRGQNAVSLAADRSHGEVIKVLAQFYPQGVDCPEESGRTPLSCAMWGSPSNVETVRILIQTGLVDVNRKALNGRTPLSYAAAVGRPDLVRILVQEGGADLDIPDNDGNAPGELYIDWRSSQAREEIDRLRGLRSKPGPT